MNYEEAKRLLAMVKDGVDVHHEVIAEALFMVGDGDCPADMPEPDMQDFVDALRRAGVI